LFCEISIRVLPHQQDTGGFFIALLSKTQNLPWEKDDLEVVVERDEKVASNGGIVF